MKFQKKAVDAPVVAEAAGMPGVLGAIVGQILGVYSIRIGRPADNPVHSVIQDAFGALPTEMWPRALRIEDGSLVLVCDIPALPGGGRVDFEIVVIPGALIVRNARRQMVDAVAEVPADAPAVPVAEAPAPVQMDVRKHADAVDGAGSEEEVLV